MGAIPSAPSHAKCPVSGSPGRPTYAELGEKQTSNCECLMTVSPAFDYVSRVSSFRYCATLICAAECSKFCAVPIKNARKLGVRAC
jgi:hypothetical protein